MNKRVKFNENVDIKIYYINETPCKVNNLNLIKKFKKKKYSNKKFDILSYIFYH